MTIGEKIKVLRGDESQAKLAEAVGVSPSAISMFETDQRIPRDETKKALAKYFGVSVEELFFTDKVYK